MITAIMKAYWKPLLALSIAVVLVVGFRIEWISHGKAQYAAGYAKAKADQRQADNEAKKQREQEKANDERDAQQRIDKARNDALDAASRAGRLQQQIDAIRKQLGEYNAAVGAGSSAGETGILLADVLSKSLKRNRQLAEYADRAAEAGRVCERQYDSLKNTAP